MKKLSPEILECLERCQECHQICLQTISYCLGQGGEHVKREHIILLQNCAEICELSVNFMATSSPFQNSLCDVCADVCDECASSCSSFGQDETMKRCADICQKCVESCRRIAQLSSAA